MTLRIAYGRICQESNCLSPVATELSDFTTAHYLEGEELELAASRGGAELPGYFRNAELSGFVKAAKASGEDIELVPLLSAWASSSGPLSEECYTTLRDRLTGKLREAGKVDGVFLAIHGAMGVHGMEDPETELLRSVREVCDVPLVCTHDLHGNLTQERIDAVDALVAYGTNPHRDHAKVGARAGRILIGIVKGEIKPTMAWRSLPMILGGGKTIDFLAPMRQIFRRMRKLERKGELLSASTFMAHPFNSSPALGWSVVTITNNDPATAERYADELAERCWSVRHEMPPEFSSAKDAIESARQAKWARRMGVVTLADTSDVVTAGSTGDSTHLLRTLLEDGTGMLSYAAVRDPAAIETLWGKKEGERVAMNVGGGLDASSSEPLAIEGEIYAASEQPGFGRTVTLAIDHLRLVVTEGPAMVMRPSFYRNVGLNPWKADIVVVKNFFPFLLFFLAMNRKTIFVKTKGITDFDAAYQLTFDGPIHPRDPVDDWRPRDQIRRGLGQTLVAE